MRRGRTHGEAPLVTLHVSGGVVGVQDELRVLVTGQVVLVVGRSGRRSRTHRRALEPAELATIGELVAVADLDAAEARARRMTPSWVHSADALSYSVTIGERRVPSVDSPVTFVAAPSVPERGDGERPPPPVAPTGPDPDPDPLRSLRAALLDVRRRLLS